VKISTPGVTRDNLGRICEELGDREGARKHRKNGTNLCSNERCGMNAPGEGQVLKRCSLCGAIFYCSVACQKADWSRHKLYCAKLGERL
jgi:hypothetical protein